MKASTPRIGSLTATNPDKPEIEVGGHHVRLQDVLPKNRAPWYKTRHLILLNCCLIVPMITNSSNGYDGRFVT
jgi:hypothetical protein